MNWRLFSISKFRKLSGQSTFYSGSVYNYSCSALENIIGMGLRQFFDLQPSSFSKVNELWIIFFSTFQRSLTHRGSVSGSSNPKTHFSRPLHYGLHKDLYQVWEKAMWVSNCGQAGPFWAAMIFLAFFLK